MSEGHIQDAIRLALTDEPGLVLWRNNTGVAELEVKTAVGRASTEQRQWLELVRRHGGFAAVVRSVEEAHAAIARARTGAKE